MSATQAKTTDSHADSEVTAHFTAGGLDEMRWHLVIWGDSVTVEKSVRLRQRLAKMYETLAGHQ